MFIFLHDSWEYLEKHKSRSITLDSNECRLRNILTSHYPSQVCVPRWTHEYVQKKNFDLKIHLQDLVHASFKTKKYQT